MRNWKEYFSDKARTETEEHKIVAWGSKEGMYAKFYQLLHQVDFERVNNFLDVGFGTAALEGLIAQKYPHVEIYGIDVVREHISNANDKNIKNATFEYGDIISIPFDDDAFDVVACIGVLQNFDGEIEDALDELCKHVCCGGYLYISTLDKNCLEFASGRREQDKTHNYFVSEELMAELENRGMEIDVFGSIINHPDCARQLINAPLHTTHNFFILARKPDK